MADHDLPLHAGKRTEEAKTLITPQMHDLLAEKAREARCTPSDLACDALYLVLTGTTYAAPVRRHASPDEKKGPGQRCTNT